VSRWNIYFLSTGNQQESGSGTTTGTGAGTSTEQSGTKSSTELSGARHQQDTLEQGINNTEHVEQNCQHSIKVDKKL